MKSQKAHNLKMFSRAAKRLLMINHIQNKSLITCYACVYCIYLLCIYKYTDKHVYIKNKLYVCILNIFKYKLNDMIINICKYFLNVYSMCLYLYIQ